jgi:cell division transport system ATP-binding protein
MIVLRNVVKTYATGKAALADVSLTVPREDFVFLVGPNGAGKSTLLKLLIRADVATSGIVIVAGHDLRQLPEPRVPAFRQQIGIVFQDIRLFPEKTVFENVAFSLQVSGLPRRRRTRDLVMEALDLVGLSGHARRFPAQISGGEQQRAAIARAIVRSPQLLIADEPTANLPPDASWEIVQLLGEINRRGVTVVVATHDSAVVDRTKRRVVELTEGRVVRDQRYGRFTPGGAQNGAQNGAPHGVANGVTNGAANGAPSGAPAGHGAEPGSTLYPVLPPSGPSVLGRTTGQLGADSGLYPALAGVDRPGG